MLHTLSVCNIERMKPRGISRWHRQHRSRLAAAAAVLALVAGACTSTSGDTQHRETARAPEITTQATFTARGSLEQAYVQGAAPGTQIVLADSGGDQVASGTADSFGSLIVRDLAPGGGYTFRAVDGSNVAGSEPFDVMSLSDVPAQDFYAHQSLGQGLNYIEMRDGISLAATVRLPPGKTLADGPFPTVIEYSGYATAAPGDALAALTKSGGDDDPLVPSSATAVGGALAPLLGFATVSLQMRGSGCSGGAMGLFDLPATADGYDAVEIAAAQPWVRGNKVGMVGISFSGISQLFVAGARPPHLAAIAPLSVTDDLYSTGVPGGIFNSGFGASWIADRVKDGAPAPEGGQPWAKALIEAGDQTCRDNQKLRLQAQDVQAMLKSDPTRVPALYDVRSPTAWATHIDVPVFLVGAFQDEQTGGQWPWLVPSLANDPDVWVTMLNGTHVDALGPATMSRWVEFLDLYVADRVPLDRSAVSSLGGVLYQQIAGASSAPIPAIRFTGAADLATARADFHRDPRIRVLMDNGGDPANPGSLGPTWEAGFDSWPVDSATATPLYLGPSGALAKDVPGEGSTVSFHPDPDARPRTNLPEGDGWKALPPYQWAPVTGQVGLGFISDALTSDLTVVGPASLDLWLESSAPDTDLQVAVTEVRPDGKEMYVQSGFLRASARALDEQASSELQPVHDFRAERRAPLPAGVASEMRIAIFPIGHAFRTGSRIRVTITAPGGDRPAWAFDTPSTGGSVTDTVSLGGAHPSRLVLPVVSGIVPGGSPPACPSLRGEPCRAYLAAGNGG